MVEENAGREAPTEIIWEPLIRDDTAAAESAVEIVEARSRVRLPVVCCHVACAAPRRVCIDGRRLLH